MGKTLTLESIVLASHNVGEADRFCILFTRERGKLAVRARAVRKPGSKLGGHLLPMRHISLQVREGSAGYMVSDASRLTSFDERNITAFLQAQQGIELLVAILHDEEPMPDLFDATLTFLHACAKESEHTVLPYTLKLLDICGTLPEESDIYFSRCTDLQKTYLRYSRQNKWDELPTLSHKERELFSLLCANLLSHISSTPLKAGVVVSAIRQSSPIHDGPDGLPPMSV